MKRYVKYLKCKAVAGKSKSEYVAMVWTCGENELATDDNLLERPLW